MENKYKELNKFLESIHMGTKTIRTYIDKCEKKETACVLNDIISVFAKHESLITDECIKHGIDPSDKMSMMKEMVAWMKKMKMTCSDFDVLIVILKAVNMGIEKGIKFIYEHADFDLDCTNSLKEVIRDYNRVYDKVCDYILDKYLVK